MRRLAERLGDDPALRVGDGARVVAAGLDVGRVGGPLERHAHLVGDRHEPVAEDLLAERVRLGHGLLSDDCGASAMWWPTWAIESADRYGGSHVGGYAPSASRVKAPGSGHVGSGDHGPARHGTSGRPGPRAAPPGRVAALPDRRGAPRRPGSRSHRTARTSHVNDSPVPGGRAGSTTRPMEPTGRWGACGTPAGASHSSPCADDDLVRAGGGRPGQPHGDVARRAGRTARRRRSCASPSADRGPPRRPPAGRRRSSGPRDRRDVVQVRVIQSATGMADGCPSPDRIRSLTSPLPVLIVVQSRLPGRVGGRAPVEARRAEWPWT